MMYNRKNRFSKYYSKKSNNKILGLPKSTVVIALFILIFFGLISTTFGAYTSNNTESKDEFEVPHIITSVKSHKAESDLAISGASVEDVQTSAQYNRFWKGKVYFLAPEKWDLSTYSHVQIDITRTTSTSSSNYQFYSGDMTRVGSSRLFYLNLSIDHSGWNQNEYIAFTANSSTYGPGTFAVSGNHYYTTPIDYGCDNSSNYYLFIPSTESQYTTTTNGNTISGSWGSDRSTLLKKTQQVNLYTNGSSSTSGGTVKMTGYYDTGDTTVTSSSVTSSSTSVSYDGIEGTEMKLEATCSTYYAFDGWYNGTTKLSSNTTYTYNVYTAKTITAKFVDAKYNVSAGTCSGGTVSVSSSPVTHSAGTTVKATANAGCSFSSWQENTNGTFSSKTSSSTTFIPNADATVKANFTLNAPSVTVPTTTVKPEYNYSHYFRDDVSVSHAYSSAVITTKIRLVRTYDSYQTSYEDTLSNLSFKAETPGRYTVYVSAKASGYGLDSGYSSEQSYTLYVLPPTPDFTGSDILAEGFDSGSGTQGDPYKVPMNSTSFKITLTAKDTYDDKFVNWNNPNYKWLINGTSYDGTGLYQKTYEIIPDTTTAKSPIRIKSRLNVDGIEGYDSSEVAIYYEIVYDFLTFEDYKITPKQKIFDLDDDPINYYLKIFSGKTSFNTQFKSSKSNLTGSFENLGGQQTNHPTITSIANYFDDTFNLVDFMQNAGVYYIKANVKSSDNTLDKTTDNSIKFVRGTSNYLSTNTIYFESDVDLSSYRILICYTDNSSDVDNANNTWVTMNKVNSGTFRYKANVPSSVNSVAFYVMFPEYYDTSNSTNSESVYAYTSFIDLDSTNICFNAQVSTSSESLNVITGSFGNLS